MKISLNWIKDFVNLDDISIKDLWNKFTMSTAEVDDVMEMGGDIHHVIIGKVVKVTPHPDSQKLKIVQVDTGNGLVQSVCGAPNVRENIYVPFAKIGGSIKKTPEIKKANVGGVESHGIICSAMEIGISDNHEGVLILTGDYTPGTDIKKVIDIDDIIIEIDNKSLTNRPDLWGHYGIAREMAALFGRPLKPLDIAKLEENSNPPALDVKIEDSEKCHRYSGLVIENIKVRFTPLNMQARLYYCGMRPISPIVDLTNYLLLEVGQPMHAFDRRYIEKIVVRSTKQPEKFTTLDGTVRTIPEGVLMICNQEKPVALAGIMGGENSEVADDTEAIVLESANFEGSSIRKNSTRIGLRTEASARFEKMLDPNLTVPAIKRFIKLLRDMQGDIKITSGLADIYPVKLNPITVTVEKAYIDKYIGNAITKEKIVNILKSLEFGVRQQEDAFIIDVPSFRSTKDITMKVDIIEEITRIHGYDNIEPRTLDVALKPLNYNEELLLDHRIRETLAEKFAFHEVNSYIWYDSTLNAALGLNSESKVRVLNPHAKDTDTLRNSMAPVMLGFASKNVRMTDKINIFEIGSVFNAPDVKSKCAQHKNLCILRGDKAKDEDSLFYELKGMVTYLARSLKNIEPEYTNLEEAMGDWIHPAKAVAINFGGERLGYISVIHPQVKQNIDKKLNMAIVELEMPFVYKISEKAVKFAEPSKYPEVTLDFSFLVDKNILFDKINQEISEFRNDLLLDCRYITVYAGKGMPEDKKSMTFRFYIGSKEKTLSSEEIEGFTRDILDYMNGKGYQLR